MAAGGVPRVSHDGAPDAGGGVDEAGISTGAAGAEGLFQLEEGSVVSGVAAGVVIAEVSGVDGAKGAVGGITGSVDGTGGCARGSLAGVCGVAVGAVGDQGEFGVDGPDGLFGLLELSIGSNFKFRRPGGILSMLDE